MTEHDWVMLGARAVACKGWRWMPGMLLLDTNRVLSVSYTQPPCLVVSCNGGPPARVSSTSAIPDLRDPATVGCLLTLVREAYGMPHLTPKMTTSIWRIEDEGAPMKWLIPDLEWAGRFGTEAAALVDALESAGLRAAHP